MGDRSSIEWTDATWNPIIGCTRVGPGCDHCYAIGTVHRGLSPQHVGMTRVVADDPERSVDWTGKVRVVGKMMDVPLRWRRPRRVFVNSLSDLFHPDVEDRTILDVFRVMGAARRHTFQVLTKRPGRMAGFTTALCWMSDEEGAEPYLTPGSVGEAPLDNVWLGTSIENDRYAWRANALRATTAAVRWISAEPLLGPLPSLDLTGIDWLVAGGESGPGARPMDPAWVRDLRDRCVEAGVAFHFKQWGNHAPGPDGAMVHVRRKGDAGRQLDGRTWDEAPGLR